MIVLIIDGPQVGRSGARIIIRVRGAKSKNGVVLFTRVEDDSNQTRVPLFQTPQFELADENGAVDFSVFVPEIGDLIVPMLVLTVSEQGSYRDHTLRILMFNEDEEK